MRKIADYFDPLQTGEIYMTDILKAFHELMSLSDEQYIYVQTQPIFNKIIKELAGDFKKFLDTLSKHEIITQKED